MGGEVKRTPTLRECTAKRGGKETKRGVEGRETRVMNEEAVPMMQGSGRGGESAESRGKKGRTVGGRRGGIGEGRRRRRRQGRQNKEGNSEGAGGGQYRD